MLLALSLATLLIGSVYWALAASFDAHRRAQRVLHAPRATEMVLDALRADLRGAVQPGGTLAAVFVSADNASVGGAVHTLTFYTTAGTASEAWTAGVREVTWTLAEPSDDYLDHTTDDASAERLVAVRRVVDNLLAPDEATVDEQVMASEAMELTFRFYDGEQWQDAWDSLEQDDALPQAVEVTLALHDPADTAEDDAAYTATRVLAVPAAQWPSDAATDGALQDDGDTAE